MQNAFQEGAMHTGGRDMPSAILTFPLSPMSVVYGKTLSFLLHSDIGQSYKHLEAPMFYSTIHYWRGKLKRKQFCVLSFIVHKISVIFHIAILLARREE